MTARVAILFSFRTGWTMGRPGIMSPRTQNVMYSNWFALFFLCTFFGVHNLIYIQVHDIARGLSYLHDNRLVHSDIKTVSQQWTL